MPQVPRVGQQIVHLVGSIRRQLESFDGKVDPARLDVPWVQVDHHQQHVRQVWRHAAVADEGVIIDAVELQRAGMGNRRRRRSNLIHARDEVPQAIRAIDVVLMDLVLLRVQVFLAPRLARRRPEVLERRAVDAVVA
jgi:hypothetical protein